MISEGYWQRCSLKILARLLWACFLNRPVNFGLQGLEQTLTQFLTVQGCVPGMILISLKVPAWENSRLLEEFTVCSSQHLKGKQDSIICSSQQTLPMDQLSFAIFYNFSLPQLYRAPLSPTPWILISLWNATLPLYKSQWSSVPWTHSLL